MEIGLGLDFTLGLSFDDQETLAREAAELGYESLWTPEDLVARLPHATIRS